MPFQVRGSCSWPQRGPLEGTLLWVQRSWASTPLHPAAVAARLQGQREPPPRHLGLSGHAHEAAPVTRGQVETTPKPAGHTEMIKRVQGALGGNNSVCYRGPSRPPFYG